MSGYFMEETFDLSIDNGIATFSWPSGRKIHMRLDVLRKDRATVNRVLDEYDRHQAEVVVLRARQMRKRGHAASS